MAAELVATLRAAGDMRNVAIAVPTHKLGDEQALAFEQEPAARAAGLRAMVWRGREAADPEAAGDAMCRDLDRVADARAAGLPVQTAACELKIADQGVTLRCPFFGVCGYQRQRTAEADVWIMAHEMLFSKRPNAIGEIAAIIVDEGAWADGLEGAAGRPITLSLDSLERVDTVPGDALATDRLIYLRRAMPWQRIG